MFKQMRFLFFVSILLFAVPVYAQRSKKLKQELPFWSAMAALAASSALDYHSGLVAERYGSVETNPLGSIVGSFGSPVVCGIAGYYIHKRAPRRVKWIGTALIVGASVPHFAAAKHNYSLR